MIERPVPLSEVPGRELPKQTYSWLPWQAWLVATVIGVALILRAGTIETGLLAEIGFLAVFMVCLVIIPLRTIAGASIAGLNGFMLAWTLLMAAQILQAPIGLMDPGHGGVSSGMQVVTDAAVMLLPALLVLTLSVCARSRPELVRMLVVITFLGVLAGIFAWVTRVPGVRFEPPPNQAIVGSWLLATIRLPPSIVSARSAIKIQIVAVFATFIQAPVILESRSRTALIVWIVSGLLAVALPGIKRAPRATWLGGGVLLLGVALSAPPVQMALASNAPALIEQARLDAFVSKETDVSSQARLIEVQDVIATMGREGGILEKTLGFGHGATYRPSTSLIAINIDPETKRIHNVHVTPAMVYLRYGLIGLFAYISLLLSLLVNSLRDYFRHRDVLSALLLVAVPMIVVDALARNAFADPGFAFVLACVALLPTYHKKQDS